MDYKEFWEFIKELAMKLPAWRLIWLSLVAVVLVLCVFADKVAVLVAEVLR